MECRAKVWLTAGTVCWLASSGVGLAADAALPVKAPVASPPPAFTWEGVYLGGHVGYGGGMKDWTNDNFNFKTHGFLGGGQIGINRQIGNFVLGIEAEASWADIKGDQAVTLGPVFGVMAAEAARSKFDSLVSVAGRLGFAADRWLVYVKGGAVWARETHGYAIAVNVPPPAVSFAGSLGGSETRLAPLLGFGAEYAFAPNWSAKAEYNYIPFPNRTVILGGTAVSGNLAIPDFNRFDIEQQIHLIKLGVNYHFRAPGMQPTIAPSRPAPGFDWSGFYLGAQAGYAFARKSWPDNDIAYDADGWLAGGIAGVNAQAGAFVAGVETEWLWANANGSGSASQPVFGGGTRATSLATNVDWIAITALRAGFVAADRWLVFGKAGIALAQETHTFAQTEVSLAGSATQALSGDRLHSGYVVGAGVEHAFARNWSARAEYNYLSFRRQNVIMTGTANLNLLNQPPQTLASFVGAISRQEMHLVKFGINYHFNPQTAVVSARY